MALANVIRIECVDRKRGVNITEKAKRKEDDEKRYENRRKTKEGKVKRGG
jgi:hypothetical protein